MFEVNTSQSIKEELEKIKETSIEAVYIDIDAIVDSPYQSRKKHEPIALQELAESIKHNKLAQPPLVRRLEDENMYELIAGHRRVAACKLLGYSTVPVIVRPFSTIEAQAINLIENLQREDLNPIEEANAIKKLIENCNYTHEQAASSLGKTRSVITNSLRLLQGSKYLQTCLENGDIQIGHAKSLLALDFAIQDRLVTMIIEKQLSVRELERMVHKIRNGSLPKQQQNTKTMNPKLALLSENTFNFAIKTQASKGQGRVIIDLETEEEVENLIKLLNKKNN